MQGKKTKALLSFVVAAIGMTYVAPKVMADTVSIDTFAGSGWTVTRVGDPTVQNAPVVNVGPPGASPLTSWISASTINSDQTAVDGLAHSAQWVSDASDGGGYSDVNGQEYVYTDTFSLINGFVGSAVFSLSGTLSSDNWIPTPTSPIPAATDGITLTYTDAGGTGSIPVSLTGGAALGQETMYDYAFNADVLPSSFTSPATFTLTVDVVNSYEDPTNGQNPGPTGLILAGSASATTLGSAVPLPRSGEMAFAIMAAMGGFAARKRLSRRSQMI